MGLNSADPQIAQAREEICTYVYSVYIVKKNQTCFLWEVYFLGLNSSLSSPTSEQVCKKRGGEASRFGPVNRFLLTDHSLEGLDNLRSAQA